MITFISFLFMMAGGINWFCVGFLQYDYVAGVFGTQASVLSRIFYIFVGIATFWILLMVVKHRGEINIFNTRFKKTLKKSDVLSDQYDSHNE